MIMLSKHDCVKASPETKTLNRSAFGWNLVHWSDIDLLVGRWELEDATRGDQRLREAPRGLSVIKNL